MLKPASMQKIAVVGTKDERQRVVSNLYDMGVMHIEPLSKEAASVLKAEGDVGGSKEVSEELLRIRSLRAALPPIPVVEKRRFSSFRDVIDASKSITIDNEVSKLKEREERLASQLDELKGKVGLVQNLQFVKEDLNIFDLESAVSFLGSVPAANYAILLQNLASAEAVVSYSSGTDPVKVIVTVPKAGLEKFGSVIQKADVRLQRVPPFKGTATEVLAKLQQEQKSKETELADISGQLVTLSKKYFGIISQVEEQLSIEAKKLEVLNNFGFTDSAFAVEGWVTKKGLPATRETLVRNSTSTQVFELESEEEPPTLLENPKRLKFFESFIRFYAVPQSHEVDPSIIFAVAFPIFFGFMLGDVGYAILILLISIWIIRRVNHPGGRSLIPAALRSFAARILKPVQFKKLAKAMILGSFVGMVMGFALNAYFGFPVNQYLFDYLNTNFHTGLPANGTFLDPISTRGLKILLLYSGYVGLFMVSFGLVLGMLNAYWMHARKHIIGKIGWLSVAWGLALFGLTLFRHGDVNPSSNPIAGGYIGLAVVGVGLIIYGEGKLAVIELPSIVSHIISYTRLLGILLASYVLAFVIDGQVVGLVNGGIAFAIAGVVLLLVGHVFNLVLGILEPGIQGARLLYVETFSKFLHGGGRPFAPFKGPRTYTETEVFLGPLSAVAQSVGVKPKN
ncbi:MAG: V-type ATP synthase subunit I [Thaumarchaeota archaeon]|nr:V-type ATP synthase subunit I [Nitrososphaerota archaeon]